ncbi:MAG: hypothetical protein DMF51_00660 [Acidobacteria bacterium]|nr:MAG: hypothetical protein DMF51_00660 [Acidobacteriota bacterium]
MVSFDRKPRAVAPIPGSILSGGVIPLDEPAMQRSLSRVLVVDDAGLFRMLEGSFVRRLGCEIVRAQDGPDVVRKASARTPDLILLDAQKPELDGPGCVRALKADPALRSIPVLVVTTIDDVAGCCAAGADAALARPLATGALEVALSSLGSVSQRRGRRRAGRGWVQLAGSHGLRRGRLKDISSSGLFLALREPIPVASPVQIAIRLPGPAGDRHVKTRGVVVRQVPPDPDSHLIPGIGVHFVEIDPADERHIAGYVNAAAVDADDGPGGVSQDRERS